MIRIEESVGNPTLIDRGLSGEIIVVRHFLQKTGAYRLLHRTVIAAAEAVNRRAAKRIEAFGFDKLHEFMSMKECVELAKLTEERVSRAAPWLYRKLLGPGLGYRGPIWVLRRPIIRFHVPYDRTVRHRALIEQFRMDHGQGRLTPLRPHRDIWFKEPPACINVWISLGTVVPGNGLSIFPSDYTNALSYEQERGVTRDQAVTRPVNVTMNEGDGLFFHARHLHASEINHSNLTRAVLSLRIAVANPGMDAPRLGRYCRVDSRQLVSYWSLHPNKSIRRWCKRLARWAPITGTTTTLSFPRNEPPRETPSSASPDMRPHARSHVSVAELTVGRPLAISEKHFLVKLERDHEQQVWRLDRRCPHEGADLALGYVEHEYIHCPWHNLPINITGGRSTCRSLRPLEARRCSVHDGMVDLN